MTDEPKPDGLLAGLRHREWTEEDDLQPWASDRTRHLLALGRAVDLQMLLAASHEDEKKGRGRPSHKNPLKSVNGKRACLLQAAAMRYREEQGLAPTDPVKLTYFQLIEIARRSFPLYGAFDGVNSAEDVTGDLGKSIRKGKAALKIDDNWLSPILDCRPGGEISE